MIFNPIGWCNTLTIHAVGDVLLHKKLQKKGIKKGFESLWQPIIPIIKKADIAYANLEGPVAENINQRGQEVVPGSARIYTSYPMFNYPPTIVPALKNSGFDIVSTANNHSLDRFGIGIDKTIEQLHKYKLLFMGTQNRDKPRKWYTITKNKGICLAWISCSQDTNGIKDPYKQVLYCYKRLDQKLILSLISKLRTQVDGIILTPHWGVQYQHKPTRQQQNMAKKWLDQGALLVLGSHPHVVQPIKKYISNDGRSTYIAYSLGNFVSNQGSLKNRSSGVLAIKLKKESDLKITSLHFYPTYMQNRGGKLQLEWVTSSKQASFRLLKRILGNNFIRLYKKPPHH